VRYLAIGFEPFENEIMAHSLHELKRRDVDSSVAIVTADLFSYEQNQARRNYEKLKENYDFKFYNYFSEYERWQSGEKGINYKEQIQKILNRNGIRTSSRIIAFSDHIFSCFERKPYYNKISAEEKERVFYYFLKKTEAILSEFKPDIIFTIERNYLVKNIFFEFAKNRPIKIYTLLGSRLGKRLYLDHGDGIGTSEYIKIKMASCHESELNLAIDWIKKYQKQSNSGGTLYRGLTEERVVRQKKGFLSYLYTITNETIRVLIAQIYYMAVDKNKKLRVYAGNNFYFILNTFLVFFRSIVGHLTSSWIFSRNPKSNNYFYYPLHYRPESSSLSLSDGLDDEVVIELISRWLPLGCTLAVKENPSMLEHREMKFYKKIKNIPSVELISYKTPSLSLIQNSLGVVSLSGTALMEARFFGKPSAAIGNPEFSEIVNCKGLSGLKDFLVKCYNKSYPTEIDDKTIRYVAVMLRSKFKFDIGWSLLNNKDRFVKELVDEIELANLDTDPRKVLN